MAKWVGRRACRCISCGWRGILKSDRGHFIRLIMGSEKFKPLHVILVITVTLLAFAAIIYWLNLETEKLFKITPVTGLIIPIWRNELVVL